MEGGLGGFRYLSPFDSLRYMFTIEIAITEIYRVLKSHSHILII